MPTKKKPSGKEHVIAQKKNSPIAKSPVKVAQNGEVQPKRGAARR